MSNNPSLPFIVKQLDNDPSRNNATPTVARFLTFAMAQEWVLWYSALNQDYTFYVLCEREGHYYADHLGMFARGYVL